MTMIGRIETSVSGDLTVVVRFANGEHLDPRACLAR
jgi:hypothetical protein